MFTLFTLCAAQASEAPSEEREARREAREAKNAAKDPEKYVWSGIALPLFGANSQDGFGFGFGGEIYSRKRKDTEGYRIKLSAATWLTTDLGYTSNYLQVDVRNETHWIGKFGYRGWSNHAFAGSGGQDILIRPGPSEVGNRVRGPFAFLGFSRPIANDWTVFAQAYYKTYFIDPGPGLLAQRRPYGVGGGTYIDLTVGLEYDTTDRWPMPTQGVRAEFSGRVGSTFAQRESAAFLAGAYAEAIGWTSFGRHLTFAGRVVGDQTLGRRPFFEQDVAGGRWRDEIGSDQALSGYGRTRTRGDGFVAAMAEFRPFFFKINHKVLDLAFHGSAFAEIAWLSVRGDMGPIMPTVGLGPQILFQGAIQCRPYMAWGWRADGPGDKRRPVAQYGISFLDPL